jgi:hypothetical protein
MIDRKLLKLARSAREELDLVAGSFGLPVVPRRHLSTQSASELRPRDTLRPVGSGKRVAGRGQIQFILDRLEQENVRHGHDGDQITTAAHDGDSFVPIGDAIHDVGEVLPRLADGDAASQRLSPFVRVVPNVHQRRARVNLTELNESVALLGPYHAEMHDVQNEVCPRDARGGDGSGFMGAAG